MFERFTEQARRSLFFARYEASMHGSERIGLLHLQLGIVRERSEIEDLVDLETADALRELVIARIGQAAPIPTSVEIPFARDAKLALERAASEADALGDAHIGTEHLLLATLALEPLAGHSLARRLDADSLRQPIRQRPSRT
jgi:ATP-dependent Clp protease ATP-binding subunit ClpC